jgi:hypothetical protein
MDGWNGHCLALMVWFCFKNVFFKNGKDGLEYRWGTNMEMEDGLEAMSNWVTPS